MKTNYLYLLPLILAIYLIIGFKLLKLSAIEEKIRKIYYWIAVLIYVFIYNNINITSLVNGAPFNLSPHTWGVIVYTIAFYIVVIVIDTYMISGTGFNEIGLLGASFKKTNKVIAMQTEFSKLVSDQVFAQSLTIGYLKQKYTKDNLKDMVIDNKYNYGGILQDVIYRYYEFLNIDVMLDIKLIDNTTSPDEYKRIKTDYKLNLFTVKRIEKYYNEGTTYYLQRKTDNIAFVTIKTDIIQSPIMLIIKSSKDLNIEIDERIFESILYILDISTMFAIA